MATSMRWSIAPRDTAELIEAYLATLTP